MIIMYSYIFKGKSHTNTSTSYMKSLGMNEDGIEAVLSHKGYCDEKIFTDRANAYKKEADPLYIEWQKEVELGNENSESYRSKWLDKCEEVKGRFKV
ncbi:hypothetical protein NVP1137O_36 [Vibrio phage 1.137.O._10N.261.46.B5]|nr:hypothetical protein NVP1119O_40 [Vibrio phage 1.119.O._10N.261.51.A9]AUR89634.1 hypothetical protein NVP1127O_42 [Vibrio phage 1.127.O._10N.286.52.E12]AUR90090.1 hypothetical protein NVP1137O_36 [Vibrio phage 1.137.O._10N.261.46.B5]AUR90412.1 hypothetical protein NVP1143O_40 [Vibrio phage 1.143.O._10N.261.55.C8]AUR96698.1 hypothetical protein NVP1231O_40 [Vibrio phage 1.231.O._10N.261.49.F8]